MTDKYPTSSSHGNIDNDIPPEMRESHRFINNPKNLAESMDFEEMESVTWRKVSNLIVKL